MSARILGISMVLVRCNAVAAPTAPIHQMAAGVRSQSSDRTWRRTRAWNRGEPLAGGSVSGGMGSLAVNRSRTYQLMPPHRPDDASPMPNARRSNGPNVTVGPGGKVWGKCSPSVLGRKFGTALDAMTAQPYAAPKAWRLGRVGGPYHRSDG